MTAALAAALAAPAAAADSPGRPDSTEATAGTDRSGAPDKKGRPGKGEKGKASDKGPAPVRGGLDPDAAAQTKAQAAAATARLEAIEADLAAAQQEYTTAQARMVSAQARAKAAGVAAVSADRAAADAAGRTRTAGDKVDRYAANLYKAGPVPVPEVAQIAVAEDAKKVLDTATVMRVVANRQAHSLVELKGAQQDAESAATAAQTAREQARAALEDARAAGEAAARAVQRSGALVRESVAVLEQLRARAVAEGNAVREERARLEALERARSLEEKAARAKLALSAPMFGLGLPPVEATRPGPKPGLPKSAGKDPGDGPAAGNHLRPRANRFTALVKDMFTVSSVGGWRPSDPISQDHPSGRAVDVMMLPHTDPKVIAEGWRIARFAQANAADLGVKYIIWQGRIWSAQRADEGWRDYTKNFPYGSNANPTTLHMDHVHVSFF